VAVIPHTIVLVAERFAEQLSAPHVAATIARGLRAAGTYEVRAYPREDPETPPRARASASEREALWERLALQEARALVIADPELCGEGPPRGASFELATRARQGGVPAHAISAVRSPDLFTARMLDLQVVLQARGERSLEEAGARLAELI
jgi:hypothetical protein